MQINRGRVQTRPLFRSGPVCQARANERSPLQQSLPSTLRTASVKKILPLLPVSFAVISHKSPGRTIFLNFTLFYASVKGRLPFHLIFYEQDAALCHDFTLDYSRHNRIAGEMSPAEKLVFPDAVPGMCYALFIYLDFVHKEHRLPVGQIFFQFFSVHHFKV